MPADHPPAAAVVVDAGGEPWARVAAVLAARTRQLPVGGIIDLVTDDPGVRVAVTEWCARHGYPVWEVTTVDGGPGFRIDTGGVRTDPGPG
ncbi:sulfurtransferase TusA family protein [Micromonospora sp. NPDC047620]|uniref:sulfurtransferase TusA family protein n=1 Tax=Micromonospora sp. NPDC047620 TaxID=3364251 RepID=UPI0037128982